MAREKHETGREKIGRVDSRKNNYGEVGVCASLNLNVTIQSYNIDKMKS